MKPPMQPLTRRTLLAAGAAALAGPARAQASPYAEAAAYRPARFAPA